MNHKQLREAFFSQRNDFWWNLFGEPYALYDCFVIDEGERANIRRATKRIGSIYDKTAMLLRQLPIDLLQQLGFPKETIPFLRQKALPFEGLIRRIDLVKDEHGLWKHYEINADTPTFIMECFHMNDWIAEHFQQMGANVGEEDWLRRVINIGIQHAVQRAPQGKVVFTAHDDHDEDWKTTGYLANLYEGECEVIPLHQLKLIENEGLYTPKGERIAVLYRQTYPIEHLIHDYDEQTKKRVGVELLKLVNENKIQFINPISSFLLQSKAVTALIWGLHEERNPFYSKEEHDSIAEHWLPTYLDSDIFIERNEGFVCKPAFGREGDTITLYHANDDVIQPKHETYHDELKVYQKLCPLPTGKIETEKGTETAHLLVGSFLIGGKGSAMGIRAGNLITGNESAFLGVGLKKG